jgi:hypothetical protein
VIGGGRRRLLQVLRTTFILSKARVSKPIGIGAFAHADSGLVDHWLLRVAVLGQEGRFVA